MTKMISGGKKAETKDEEDGAAEVAVPTATATSEVSMMSLSHTTYINPVVVIVIIAVIIAVINPVVICIN